MKPRQEIGSENFGGIVVIGDLGMDLLGGSGNRFRIDFGNGFVGMVLEVVLGLVLC